jgi:hypothetical protein
MTTLPPNRNRPRPAYWAWPGPANLYVGLIAIALWIPVLVYGRNSGFVLASATAVTICASLALGAIRRGYGQWSQNIAWVIRIGAAITGFWLYTATPNQPWRLILVPMYVLLYIVCEMAVWRRVRADRNATT